MSERMGRYLLDEDGRAEAESVIEYVVGHPDDAAHELVWRRQRIVNAERLIAAAVEIMTPDQVGQWAGVRAWQEDFPE